VENLYHLSFLIWDGTCSLPVAENGEPLVCQFYFPSCDPLLNSVSPFPTLSSIRTTRWHNTETNGHGIRHGHLEGQCDLPVQLLTHCFCSEPLTSSTSNILSFSIELHPLLAHECAVSGADSAFQCGYCLCLMYIFLANFYFSLKNCEQAVLETSLLTLVGHLLLSHAADFHS
jgi:hypothetical protein